LIAGWRVPLLSIRSLHAGKLAPAIQNTHNAALENGSDICRSVGLAESSDRHNSPFDYEVNRTTMEVNWIALLYIHRNFQENFKFRPSFAPGFLWQSVPSPTQRILICQLRRHDWRCILI